MRRAGAALRLAVPAPPAGMEASLAREHETRAGRSTPDKVDTADDAALMAGVVRGDAASFRTLVTRHLPLVTAVARRMLRDNAEAEDVAQEALIKLWRTGASVEIGVGGLKPWLRRVTANLCIDRMRANGRLLVTDEVPEQEVQPDQLTALTGQDLASRVAFALGALPDRQRIALTLFHFEGLSQIEVGKAMGISDEAVESLLGRARRTLRSALKDEWRELLSDMPD